MDGANKNNMIIKEFFKNLQIKDDFKIYSNIKSTISP
jgi:hypothetical protein